MTGVQTCALPISLFNPAGLVFVGRRANRSQREHTAPGHEWQMPQGGIDAGEQPIEAAYRELREETNVSSVSLLAEAPDWLSYDLPREIGKEAWRGKYRGQSQKWFAFRFEGDESEIDILNPGGGHKPEFDAWRWVPLAETAELIIPFKREVYREVVRLFAGVAR